MIKRCIESTDSLEFTPIVNVLTKSYAIDSRVVERQIGQLLEKRQYLSEAVERYIASESFEKAHDVICESLAPKMCLDSEAEFQRLHSWLTKIKESGSVSHDVWFRGGGGGVYEAVYTLSDRWGDKGNIRIDTDGALLKLSRLSKDIKKISALEEELKRLATALIQWKRLVPHVPSLKVVCIHAFSSFVASLAFALSVCCPNSLLFQKILGTLPLDKGSKVKFGDLLVCLYQKSLVQLS